MSMRRTLFMLLAVFTTAACSAVGSDFNGGTRSPLRFGVGARELSLGGAAIARCDASTAPFWNPARLAGVEYASFSGFYTQLFESDVTYQYVGIAIPTLDFGAFGMGIQRLGVSDIERRDADNLLTGHFSDNRLGVHLGYGRYWHTFQIGVSVGFEHHSLDTYSATSSPDVDMAAMKRLGSVSNWIRDVDIVFSASNVLGSSVELDQESISEPASYEAGLSTSLLSERSTKHHLELSTRLLKVDQTPVTASAGIEYSYSEMLSIRGGINDDNWSAGVGVRYHWFNLDYAVVDRDLGLLHMFAVTTTFGSSLSERLAKRAARRESEFQERMRHQLVQRNTETISALLSSGKTALEAEQLSTAVDDFDRALFLARNVGLDTTEIATLLANATKRRDDERRLTDHKNYLDSARTYLSGNDLLNARYYAGLAETAWPGSREAGDLLANINEQLRQSQERDALVKDQVRQIDSLLTYGRYDEAIARATSLQEMSPNDDVVAQLLKRARFQSLRDRGDRAFDAGNYQLTLNIIHEAEQLFPEHQWARALRDRVAQATKQKVAKKPAPPTKKEMAISESARDQAEEFYLLGQKAFERGDFEEAIANWERVELLAPNYQSVRTYLVQAYKYLGVEYYSDNNLDRALTVWRRAAELMPDNQEIASYIKRTEAEKAKIRELSYEP